MVRAVAMELKALSRSGTEKLNRLKIGIRHPKNDSCFMGAYAIYEQKN